MKKYIILFVIILAVFDFSACDLQIPTGIKIKGTFENSIPAKMDIGAMFTGEIENSFKDSNEQDQTIFTCTATEYKTFLVHLDLFNEKISLGEGDELPPSFDGIDIGIPIVGRKDLTINQKEVVLPFDGLGGYLEGFHFSNMVTKLYFSGSKIVEKLSIDVQVVGGDMHTFPDLLDPDHLLNNSSSGYKSWGDSYNKKEMPGGGYKLNVPPDGTEVRLNFEVYIEDKTLEEDDFDDGILLVELIVWLPLEFIAVQDNAKISFPEDSLFGDDDLFGRSEDDMSITEMIKTLKLDIMFNRNPFKNGNLVVWSGLDESQDPPLRKIEIERKITDNALTINMDEKTMKDINNIDNYPFAPELEILFGNGSLLKFPRNFTAVELAFKAGIDYGMNW